MGNIGQPEREIETPAPLEEPHPEPVKEPVPVREPEPEKVSSVTWHSLMADAKWRL